VAILSSTELAAMRDAMLASFPQTAQVLRSTSVTNGAGGRAKVMAEATNARLLDEAGEQCEKCQRTTAQCLCDDLKAFADEGEDAPEAIVPKRRGPKPKHDAPITDDEFDEGQPPAVAAYLANHAGNEDESPLANALVSHAQRAAS